MFAEQYGLREDPFAPGPDTRYMVLTQGHQEALATLVYAIEQQEGWALLLGGAGVGKTITAAALLRELGEAVAPTMISLAGLANPLELFNRLALELGLPGPYVHKARFLADFKQMIKSCHAEGRTILLLVDDAQLGLPELLLEIGLLGNADDFSPRVLNIFLLARPQLVYLLDRAGAWEFKQLFRRFSRLGAMDRAETGRYLVQRLRIAGGREDLFDDQAQDLLYEASQGVPRRVNALAGLSLRRARGQAAPTIGRALVQEVVDRVRAAGVALEEVRPPGEGLLAPADLACPVSTPLPQLNVEQQILEDSLASRHHRAYRGMPWWERTVKFTVEWDRMRRRRLGILGTFFPNFCSRWDQPHWQDFNRARQEADAFGARYQDWLASQLPRALGNGFGAISPADLHGPWARERFKQAQAAGPVEATPPAPAPLPPAYDPADPQQAARARQVLRELLDLSQYICDGTTLRSEDLLAEAVCQAVLPLQALDSQSGLRKRVSQALAQRPDLPPDPPPTGNERPPIII